MYYVTAVFYLGVFFFTSPTGTEWDDGHRAVHRRRACIDIILYCIILCFV